jgi:redox-sensitive bicupin YhaK (pirin superfamily)
MQHILFKGSERGIKDIGWLKSNFTFSFSSYYNPSKNGFGLLKVFNDDFVEAGKGFGLHAHQNMEIISILLSGQMNHKDSMGYTDVVETDWVQIMSAGSGLRHEEYNVGTNDVNFLQIWIEPKLQNINPRYQRRQFPKETRKNKLVTVVSNEEGQQHCWINQNAKLSLGWFEEGQSCNYQLNPLNKGIFVFLINGEAVINGIKIGRRDAVGFWETDQLNIELLKETELVIIEAPINH